MAVSDRNTIDIVAEDHDARTVLLVMVEPREWGEVGALLPDLQDKLNTYIDYAESEKLLADFPSSKGKKVRIELRCASAPGARELEFLSIVERNHLGPLGISFRWRLYEPPREGPEDS